MAIKSSKTMMVERIALAISQGKTFHVFLYGQYFRSFHHREAAECYHSGMYKDDFAMIRLTGGK